MLNPINESTFLNLQTRARRLMNQLNLYLAERRPQEELLILIVTIRSLVVTLRELIQTFPGGLYNGEVIFDIHAYKLLLGEMNELASSTEQRIFFSQEIRKLLKQEN